jgi:hypothetical protein
MMNKEIATSGNSFGICVWGFAQTVSRRQFHSSEYHEICVFAARAETSINYVSVHTSRTNKCINQIYGIKESGKIITARIRILNLEKK